MFQMAVPIEPCFIVPLMVQSQSQDLWVELMLPRREQLAEPGVDLTLSWYSQAVLLRSQEFWEVL